jgi:hypothetical protein
MREEVQNMEEKNKASLEEKKKKKKPEEKLPYCTTAPSAEHARASEEDEPCDDGTGGGTGEEVEK